MTTSWALFALTGFSAFGFALWLARQESKKNKEKK